MQIKVERLFYIYFIFRKRNKGKMYEKISPKAHKADYSKNLFFLKSKSKYQLLSWWVVLLVFYFYKKKQGKNLMNGNFPY